MSTENLISDDELDKASGGGLRKPTGEFFGTSKCPGPENFDCSYPCDECYSLMVDSTGLNYCSEAC
ncbi:hypothetical protein I6U48_04025 [Clostridium sp. PL3]|uniref:Uncharacterized protein n=1 Tax=Clostridium thailandense TaxID=2794346 RepID=A0A949TX57_9CLOT|nr:hypothetical protein [Clostridium thailandense]MBV7272084.1 hypothetical protein [Clostridium thailandense]